MADTITVNSQYGTYYYIDSSSARDVLTRSQMEANVTVLYNVVSHNYPTWSINAIAALCGNAQSEGALNPNQWQYGLNKNPNGGYGLWQWTPATKFLNWAAQNGYPKNDILHQVIRLNYERQSGIQYYKTPNYNFSFTEFLEGDYSVDTLARAWLYNYERPKDPEASEEVRVSNSENWYEFLTGKTPEPPTPTPDPKPKKAKLPFYMYPAWRRV